MGVQEIQEIQEIRILDSHGRAAFLGKTLVVRILDSHGCAASLGKTLGVGVHIWLGWKTVIWDTQ